MRRRPPRTPAEVEAGRLYARRRRRIALGWPAERLDDPPARRSPAGPRPGPAVPIPNLEDHPLVVEALAELRPWERHELDRGMDACARDLVGAYVLAVVAGEDPHEALRRERARYRHDRAALVYGLHLVTGLAR